MFDAKTPDPVLTRQRVESEGWTNTVRVAHDRAPVGSSPVNGGYRREIDGLRAIAVMLVIFYHARPRIAGIDIFSGGFIGVDVFFVISGYLIGAIIQREIAAGHFSFIRFYERRARRILPALYAVLALTIVPAWLYLLPDPFMDYAASLVASVASASNLYFWHSGSYDAGETLYKPLIHTWSLGVEEQFYLLFPPLMLLAWRYVRRWIVPILAVVCLASVLLAERTSGTSPDASFFLLPTRVWEMAVGALLAQRELHHGRRITPMLGRTMPIAGLALLLMAVPIMQPHWHHPGLATIIPVAGTALLIRYMGKKDVVTRLLSSRPFVFIGLISYSLYLWHQPIFAFGRLMTINSPSGPLLLAWVFLAIGAATATYWLVEVPTRDRQRMSSRTIWAIALAGALLLGGFGVYGYSKRGHAERFAPTLSSVAQAADISEARVFQHGKSCHDYKPSAGPCVFPGQNPDGFSLVSVGDSHARTLTGPLSVLASRNPEIASFAPLNRGGCVFLMGIQRVNDAMASCPPQYNRARLAYVLGQKRPIAVILLRLPMLIEQSRFENGQGGVEPGEDRPHLSRLGETDPADNGTIASAISQTVHTLLERGVKVVLVYPVPEMGWNVPQLLLVRARQGVAQSSVSVPYSGFRVRTLRTYQMYDAVGNDPNLLRIYPARSLCDGQRCYGSREGRIFYRDDNHFSFEGATVLSRAILDGIAAKWGGRARP
ncbi:MAG: hypothetical protein JWO15_1255 [Sphingomonadales bacterium]|nr:hypothetical protein [Sphingomonadales bacterium]